MTATITDLFCGAGGSFARRARQEREIGHAICSTEVRGADLQLPKVRLGYAGHLQALRWIRREPEPQAD